jgi:GMP synthase-like glutamine amidotransferase
MRERGIAWDTVELDEGGAIPALDGYDALLVFGGPMNVDEEARLPWLRAEVAAIREAVRRDLPCLGVCLGGQLLAKALGAPVTRAPKPEVGVMPVTLTPAAETDPLFRTLAAGSATGPASPTPTPAAATGAGRGREAAAADRAVRASGAGPLVFQWHGDMFAVPAGATLLASSEICPQAFRHGRAWGLQFHLEVTPDMVQAWGGVAEYRAALEALRGPGAMEELLRETERHAGALAGACGTVFRGFVEMV